MTKVDMPRLARVLAVLGETFNETVSDIRADGYFMGLSDLAIEQVESGARQALKASRFFPRPAELRAFAVGSPEDTAEMAWLELLQAVRRVGCYGSPELSESINATVRGLWGDWRRLCETLPGDGPELLGWAKRFKSTYSIMTMRQNVWIDSHDKSRLLLKSDDG